MGSLPIFPLFYSLLPIACVLLVLNSISWCFILQLSEHLINFIVLFFQLTSELYLTNQLWPKNMSVLLKSITTASSCFLCLLISISRSTTLVTSLFFISSILKILNEKFISLVCICFFNQLLIDFYMYASEVHQCLDLEVFATLHFHICLHVQFSFYITPSVWNNIFILRIYRGDLL